MDSIKKAEQRLKALRKNPFGLDELVDHSSRLIPLLIGKQVRYKVNDFPDKRTVRYYVQEGLIDRPTRQGRQAMFFYRHLLQVLAVKKLQTDYFSLKKIAQITRRLDNRELENLLMAELQDHRNALLLLS